MIILVVIIDCNVLMRPYIIGINSNDVCRVPSTYVLYTGSYLQDKTPLSGAVFIAIKSVASSNRPCAFKCWSCHLLCVILVYKTGVIIARTSQGVCGTK